MENDGHRNLFDEVLKSISKHIMIIIAYPDDINKIDMNEIDRNVWFIKNVYVEPGKMIIVTDEELKFTIYKECLNDPDLAITGNKHK